jgi:predicted protein tyrosine phosphatase
MKLRVSSLARAEDIFAELKPDRVVSLVDRVDKVPKFSPCWHLRLNFGDNEVIWHPWAPTFSDVQTVFDFVQPGDTVLVHCIGGICRSVAASIGLLVREEMIQARWENRSFDLEATVNQVVQQLLTDSPGMSPNKLILEFVDRHLQLDGKLKGLVAKAIEQFAPKELQLWCADCKIWFEDGKCPCDHFTKE